MKVWRVENLFDNFNEFIIPLYKGHMYLDKIFNTNVINDKVDLIEVDLLVKAKDADCHNIWGMTGVLMVSEKAKNKIESFITNEVEFIKVINKEISGTFYALHVLNVIDALDYDKTKFVLENKLVKEYAFIKKEIENENLFIVYEGKRIDFFGKPNIINIFVSEKFKNHIENSDLKGFRFIEVWDSELPPFDYMRKESLKYKNKESEEDDITMENIKENERQAFYNHIENYVGTISSVFTEIVPDSISIDIFIVNPTEERPFYTLVTYGMSSIPMNIPEGYEDSYGKCRYEELMLCLPEEWEFTNESIQDEKWYWPIRLLKILAKKPHKENAFLTFTHIFPYSQDEQYVVKGERFAENIGCNNSLIFIPKLFGEKFKDAYINENKTVKILSVRPIYEEEKQYAEKYGIMALVEKFDDIDFSELVNLDRINVCK